IDVIDHRRERRRLAASRGTRDEDEPLLKSTEPLADVGREIELDHRLDVVRNDTQDGADRAPLVEDVRSEPAQTGDTERHVELPLLLETQDLLVIENAVDELLRRLRIEHFLLGRDEPPGDTDHRRRSGGDVEVGATALDELLDEFLDRDHFSFPFPSLRCTAGRPPRAGAAEAAKKSSIAIESRRGDLIRGDGRVRELSRTGSRACSRRGARAPRGGWRSLL